MLSKRYAAVGLAVVLVAVLFVTFSEGEEDENYDITGIVHDIRGSSNGFIFYIDTVDSQIRCFSRLSPVDLGYYGLKGSFSEDGSIFFVEMLTSLEGHNYRSSNKGCDQDVRGCG